MSMKTTTIASIMFLSPLAALFGQAIPQLDMIAAPIPSLPSTFNPTFQTLYTLPGIRIDAGQVPATNALFGITFNAFNAGSMALRAFIGARSGGNWGQLSFHTQDGGTGQVYERMRIDSSGNIGIGTTTPTAKLDIVGGLKIEGTGSGIVFPDGTTQVTASPGGGPGPQGPAGPQGLIGLQGPAGLPVHTSAICANNVPQATSYVSSCKVKSLTFRSIPNSSCTVTSDTGSCQATGSNNASAVCEVCSPQ